MRALFCQTYPYIPSETGGALSTTHEFCQLLCKNGVDVAVLAGARRGLRTRFQSVAFSDFPSRDDRLGYAVYRAIHPVAAAAALIEKERPEMAVVQVGDIVRLVRVFLSARIPTVVFFHDIYSMPPAGELPQDDLLRFAACSALIAEHVRRLYAAEPFLVPVLVQPRLYLTETLRRVVTFVNPRQLKGLDIAIGLATARPDIPFEFVESTSLAPEAMRSLAVRLSAHGNVRLIRRTDDMRKIYHRSRLVLMPSLCIEAWGRVVSEAQVSGIPALASSSGGLPETVGPGGITVDREAPLSDWVAALGRLWDDASEYQRYAEAAMRHASRPEIRPDVVIARMMELITRMSASGR